MQTDLLAQSVIAGERKSIIVSRRRNANGDFLRIDEIRPGAERFDIVIIPEEYVGEFLSEVAKVFPEAVAARLAPQAH